MNWLVVFYFLGALLIMVLGFLLLSCLAARCLKISASWLGFHEVDFRTALKCSLITNFIWIMLIVLVYVADSSRRFQMTSQNVSRIRMSEVNYDGPIRQATLSDTLSPTAKLCVAAFSLVIATAVLGQVIETNEDKRVASTRDFFVLACLYQGLTLAILLLLCFVLGLLVIGFLNLLGYQPI